MHLEALRDVEFTVAGKSFGFRAGETIHTENSHKYGYRDSRLLLHAAGWGLVGEWADDQEWFSIILAEAEAASPLIEVARPVVSAGLAQRLAFARQRLRAPGSDVGQRPAALLHFLLADRRKRAPSQAYSERDPQSPRPRARLLYSWSRRVSDPRRR